MTRGATRRFNKRGGKKGTKGEEERERERDKKILMLFINRFLMCCSGQREREGGEEEAEGLWSGAVALAAV